MPGESFEDALAWNLGRYTLHGEIAAGGMATVHLGRMNGAAGFTKTVAIKRLHAQYAHDPDFLSMFLDEARLAARVVHPNVVQPLDVITTDGEVFLVMEYIRGEALSRLIRALRPTGERFPLRIVGAIMVGVLHGLHAAHEAKNERGVPLGIVHRDISPQNILVGTDGVARVLDFGIAKAVDRASTTREGDLKGKLAYMAPEQLTGERDVDRRTDVYAASIVLWELLTGLRLFDSDYQTALTARDKQQVRAPSAIAKELTPELDAAVLRGLAPRMEDRYATAREMAIALETAMPLATPSTVGEWVEEVAAPTLAARATRIEEIEAEEPVTSPSERQRVVMAQIGRMRPKEPPLEETRADRASGRALDLPEPKPSDRPVDAADRFKSFRPLPLPPPERGSAPMLLPHVVGALPPPSAPPPRPPQKAPGSFTAPATPLARAIAADLYARPPANTPVPSSVTDPSAAYEEDGPTVMSDRPFSAPRLASAPPARESRPAVHAGGSAPLADSIESPSPPVVQPREALREVPASGPPSEVSIQFAKARTPLGPKGRRALVAAGVGGGILVVAALALAVGMPMLLTHRAIGAAEALGLTMEVEGIDWTLSRTRLHGVRLVGSALPGITVIAPLVELTHGAAGDRAVVSPAEITIEGSFTDVTGSVTEWLDAHKGAGLPELHAEGVHVVWQRPFGPATSLDAEGSTFDAEASSKSGFAGAFAARLDPLRLHVRDAIFGPLKLSLEHGADGLHVSAEGRDKVKLDAKFKAAGWQAHLAVAAASLEQAGIPRSAVGLDTDPATVTTTIDLASEPSKGELHATLKVDGGKLKEASASLDLDATLDAIASQQGEATALQGTFALGTFRGIVTGPIEWGRGYVALDASWKAAPRPCDRVDKSDSAPAPRDLAALKAATSSPAGPKDVVLSGRVTLDTRDLGATRVTGAASNGKCLVKLLPER